MDRLTFFSDIPSMPQHQREKILWAYEEGKQWHKGTLRDGGERYFEHVRRVAHYLISHGYVQADFIILAILHDILEDTFFSLSKLERLFGHRIAREILIVSKTYPIEDPLTGTKVRSAKRSREEYFRNIKLARRPSIAKCADRIDNLADLVAEPSEESRWTPKKRLEYVDETREWIIPLADEYEPRFAEVLRHRCDIIDVKLGHLRDSLGLPTMTVA